jgi:hypothetical protein
MPQTCLSCRDCVVSLGSHRSYSHWCVRFGHGVDASRWPCPFFHSRGSDRVEVIGRPQMPAELL